MDADRINKILDATDDFESTDFARASRLMVDKEAKANGIEQITIMLKDESIVSLTKNKYKEGYLLTMSQGQLNIDGVPKFELIAVTGQLHRFFIKGDAFSYHVDLIDRAMADDLAAFCGVEVGEV